MIILVTSCATKNVVINQQNDVVRLSNDVKGHVYYWDGTNWVKSSNKITLPEGWFAGPGPSN